MIRTLAAPTALLALTTLMACDTEAARQRALETELEASRQALELPASERARPSALGRAMRVLITPRHVVVDPAAGAPLGARSVSVDAADITAKLTTKLLGGSGPLVLEVDARAPAELVLATAVAARAGGYSELHVALEGAKGATTLPLSDLSSCAPADEGAARETCEACPAAQPGALGVHDGPCAFPTIAWATDGVHIRLDPAMDRACAPELGELEATARPASHMGAWVVQDAKACPAADSKGGAEALRALDARARLCTSATLAPTPQTPWGDVAATADVLVHELAFERVSLTSSAEAGVPSCEAAYVFGDL